VARLLTSRAFKAQLDEQFEGDWRMVLHLAPPWLGGAKGITDRPRKHDFGALWQFGMRGLAMLRGLRGTWLDPMGYSRDRREDRAVLAQYVGMLETILRTLNTGNLETACKVAELADKLKGYGPVRHANLVPVQSEWARLMTAFGKA
jgi:indolepyruvate ferredoxin oxidoreductase